MINKIKNVLLVTSFFLISLCLAQQPKIAIVTSKFNAQVTQMFHEDALARFAEQGIIVTDEDVFFVPGAIEIPVVVSRLVQSGNYDAVVCLGTVKAGYVCSQVSYGCQKIAVKYGVPVIFGIAVIENNEETWIVDRYGKMGTYVADAALEMAHLMTRF